MSLNIRTMLQGTIVRMRYVHRWSTSRVHFPENVAEHTFFVAFYSLMICQWLKRTQRLNVDVGDVLTRAILHDVEEARSGDIHRPFKYSSPGLTEALQKASVVAASQVFEGMFSSDFDCQTMANWANNSKDATTAGCVVRFADFLGVLSFILQEGPGAVESLDLRTLSGHYQWFRDSMDCAFLSPLIEQAGEIVRGILEPS